MKKSSFLSHYVKVADIHASRLQTAIEKTVSFFPLSEKTLLSLKGEEIALLDMMTTRFGKLQDLIGGKIFPIILDILGETAPSFRDKLNTLERLGVIQDAYWWLNLREIRNQLTHDYPDDYIIIARHFNKLLPLTKELLLFFEDLKIYISKTVLLYN